MYMHIYLSIYSMSIHTLVLFRVNPTSAVATSETTLPFASRTTSVHLMVQPAPSRPTSLPGARPKNLGSSCEKSKQEKQMTIILCPRGTYNWVKGLIRGPDKIQAFLLSSSYAHSGRFCPPRPTALFLDGSFAGGDQAMTPTHHPVTEGTTPRRTTLPY